VISQYPERWRLGRPLIMGWCFLVKYPTAFCSRFEALAARNSTITKLTGKE